MELKVKWKALMFLIRVMVGSELYFERSVWLLMWEQGRLEAGQLGHICAEHLLFVSTDLPYNLTCSLCLN